MVHQTQLLINVKTNTTYLNVVFLSFLTNYCNINSFLDNCSTIIVYANKPYKTLPIFLAKRKKGMPGFHGIINSNI